MKRMDILPDPKAELKNELDIAIPIPGAGQIAFLEEFPTGCNW